MLKTVGKEDRNAGREADHYVVAAPLVRPIGLAAERRVIEPSRPVPVCFALSLVIDAVSFVTGLIAATLAVAVGAHALAKLTALRIEWDT
jgi:hypothetical protein